MQVRFSATSAKQQLSLGLVYGWQCSSAINTYCRNRSAIVLSCTLQFSNRTIDVQDVGYSCGALDQGLGVLLGLHLVLVWVACTWCSW